MPAAACACTTCRTSFGGDCTTRGGLMGRPYCICRPANTSMCTRSSPAESNARLCGSGSSGSGFGCGEKSSCARWRRSVAVLDVMTKSRTFMSALVRCEWPRRRRDIGPCDVFGRPAAGPALAQGCCWPGPETGEVAGRAACGPEGSSSGRSATLSAAAAAAAATAAAPPEVYKDEQKPALGLGNWGE
eukprot:362776-Chlamydomonas_euryale.AAC.9